MEKKISAKKLSKTIHDVRNSLGIILLHVEMNALVETTTEENKKLNPKASTVKKSSQVIIKEIKKIVTLFDSLEV